MIMSIYPHFHHRYDRPASHGVYGYSLFKCKRIVIDPRNDRKISGQAISKLLKTLNNGLFVYKLSDLKMDHKAI